MSESRWTNYGKNFYNAFWREVCKFVPLQEAAGPSKGKDADPFYPEEDVQKYFPDKTGFDVFQTLQAAYDCLNVGNQLKSFTRNLAEPADYTPKQVAEILFEMTFAVEPSENPTENTREHLKDCQKHKESYLALAHAFESVLIGKDKAFGPTLSQWMDDVKFSPADPQDSHTAADNRHTSDTIAFYETEFGRPLSAEEKLLIAVLGDLPHGKKKKKGN